MATIEKILFKKDGTWDEYNTLNLASSSFIGSKRGISFITLEGQNRLINDEDKGFCHKRFKANFIISEIEPNNLVVGQFLRIGDSIIKITKVGKECLMECPIVKESNISCDINKQAFFGEIVKEGLVNKNDEVLV